MMKKKIKLSTTQTIMLSFLIVIFIGSLLLSLPISSADGNAVSYLDALFTSATATCVTGLVTVPTFSTWSLFGQIVILLLIFIFAERERKSDGIYCYCIPPGKEMIPWTEKS